METLKTNKITLSEVYQTDQGRLYQAVTKAALRLQLAAGRILLPAYGNSSGRGRGSRIPLMVSFYFETSVAVCIVVAAGGGFGRRWAF